MKTSILAISGRINSGKDACALIIQYLLDHRINTTHPKARDEQDDLTYMPFETWKEKTYAQYSLWQNKKFAKKLKVICSILLNIPVEDFEKPEVKNSLLPDEWQLYEIWKFSGNEADETITRFTDKNHAFDFCAESTEYFYKKTKRTVRWFLQNVGTEAFRSVIHPNTWVNALFSEYTQGDYSTGQTCVLGLTDNDKDIRYPNWIITDLRFPQEMAAIKKRGGITLRIKRPGTDVGSTHPSETSLDNAKFDYEIDNDGTIDNLIEKVQELLTKEKLL